MFGLRSRTLTPRPPAEARTGMVVIVLISSLAFLLFQARKDALDNLVRHEARLAIQFATAANGANAPPGAPQWLDKGEARSGNAIAGVAAWPGQTTVIVRPPFDCAHDLRCRDLTSAETSQEDTKGHFVIRAGRLFASIHRDGIAAVSTAPLTALAAGVPGRLSMDIVGVFFLGWLLLLVRESRLSDYSVHRLLDASPVPLLLSDANGHIEFANLQARELFVDEAAGSLADLESALRRETRLHAWLTSGQESAGAIETAEFETVARPDAVRHLLVSRQSLQVRSRRVIIASVADITVRHQAQTALLEAKNAAEALGRMKSESLAMISHELRTPVNGVLGLAQLLGRYALPEGAAQIVRRMIQAGRTLAAIINDIVDLALLEVRQIRLEPRRFDIRETLTGAATLASAAATAKGLLVRVTTLAPLPPAVYGDPARLQQIIINLVSNGIKFTEAGHIEVKIDVAARRDDGIDIVIEVADTGIGIAPEIIPRLFQPFSQGETGREKRFAGTGLGLAISKGLAEAMGGTISVRSEVGRGSTFAVRLPFALAQPEESRPQEPLAARVLVVDDVALNRDIVSELLSAEGCSVTSAASGQEALETLETKQFDLILMDIRMPTMDGLAVTAAIRAREGKHGHAAPILGLTANPLPTERPLYLLRGLDGVIDKPVDADKLRAALRELALPAQSADADETPRIRELRRSLGDERTLRIVRAFAQTAGDAIEGIVTGCAHGNFADVAGHAHKLAGAAANLRFGALADAAAELERLAEAGGALQIADAASMVVTLYRDAERYVRVSLSSSPAGPANR
jgi:signal transduction histidine kinase/CheY-like chemotaxis protein/HPt (histidine-containing phosphotransfer) domain-containing protein